MMLIMYKYELTLSRCLKWGFLTCSRTGIHTYPHVIHKMWITLCKLILELCKVDNFLIKFTILLFRNLKFIY